APVAVGGIIAGAREDDLDKLRAYGETIGLALQIADDILDVTASSEHLGKTPGKDQAANTATYPSVHGIAAPQQRARDLVEQAVEIISSLPLRTNVLEELARFIIARTS